MRTLKLCPSMMCADFTSLGEETRRLTQSNVDIFHIDVMDGVYVPNLGMGPLDFEAIKSSTKLPIDVHLMVMNPINYVDMFAKVGADIIYIHPDADLHPARTLSYIKSINIKAGIAINPDVSLSTVKELFPLCDYVMIMTVNPGFSGQKYLDFTTPKVMEFLEMKKKYGFELFLDGAISPDHIGRFYEKGVDGFVLGTSSLFGKNEEYSEIISGLRKKAKETNYDLVK